MVQLEKTILKELLGNSVYAQKVLPHLDERYFHSTESGNLFTLIKSYYTRYKVMPSSTALRILIDKNPSYTEAVAKNTELALTEVEGEPLQPDAQLNWALDETEAYCQERALYCALQDAIKVMDDPKATRFSIPDMMKTALSVSFDTHIGHDFFADAGERYDYYHRPEARLPFTVRLLNDLTKQGTPRKTLNAVLAGTNVGKSLALVDMSSGWLRQNFNVLYITCEMAQEAIAERVDANMMDIPLDDVMQLSRASYMAKINHLRNLYQGKLKIKEYPTGTCHTGLIQALLQDLRMKENFKPDVIVVDYLTICASSRVKLSQAGGGYAYYKYIAEELRALAVEEDVAVWTAAQFNRTGFASSDPGLEHVGESFGIPQTADFCIALVTTEELDKLGQYQLIELKNRYRRKRVGMTHLLGVDTDRMKLYDLNSSQIVAGNSAATIQPAPQPNVGGSLSKRRRVSPLADMKGDEDD